MYFSFQNMLNSSIIGALQYRVGNKIILKDSNNHDSALKSSILKPSNRGGQKPSLRAQCHILKESKWMILFRIKMDLNENKQN